MCEECRQTPCHPRCPNADEPEVVCYCELCGEEIREGDAMYKIFDCCICEECVNRSLTFAEF